ncbi:MAG: FAD-binding oxidoreductase [Actinobacteria bacterium]|nr:FAD-binding oxidoreductase [Actinomycetota bacterium]
MIVKTEKEFIQNYLTDASNYKSENCDAVFFPVSSDEVSEILKKCSRDKTAVTISGAGTGLVGGRVPQEGVVISLEKMNSIISIDKILKGCQTQAGVLLSQIQTDCREINLLYPPDPTENNCAIGGTIATNASGSRTFKYGSTRNWINYLKVILANGETVELERGINFADNFDLKLQTNEGTIFELTLPKIKMPHVKNAAGYFIQENIDAIDLFIGMEGTLGVITEAELKLIDYPNDLISGVIFFNNFNDMYAFVSKLKKKSFEKDSKIKSRAIEFFDDRAINFLSQFYPKTASEKFAVWIEQEIYSENKDELMSLWYDLIGTHKASLDSSYFAMNEKDINDIREFRHAISARISEYLVQNNLQKVGTDLAVPAEHFEQLYHFCIDVCKTYKIDYVGYGHIGNDHLHLNMLPNDQVEYEKAKKLYFEFCKKAVEFGGTVSAEHGIGKLKKEYFKLMYNPEEIAQMYEIKRILDPNLILGRGNIF